ncbi:TIR domain-containing protein [Methanosphaera sp.]
MLDLFPEEDLKKWKLFISYPKDCEDYNTFISRLESATEAFKWEDITNISETGYAEAIADSDALIVLSGLWDDNRDMIEEHIKYAKSFEKAIIIIRPYGAEEIPLELQEVATKVVGWNTACIVDAILLSINGEDYEFLM